MTVADIGCAMGFFSLPMARLVGDNGHVFCIDVQQEMIDALLLRARKKGLADRITARLCSSDSLELDDLHDSVDFSLAYYVVHEVPDKNNLMSQVYSALKPGGRFLIEEPKGHVSKRDFQTMLLLARDHGFEIERSFVSLANRGVLLSKAQDSLPPEENQV